MIWARHTVVVFQIFPLVPNLAGEARQVNLPKKNIHVTKLETLSKSLWVDNKVGCEDLPLLYNPRAQELLLPVAAWRPDTARNG